MSTEPDQPIAPASDEIFLDLRKLTVRARGAGLSLVPKILWVFVLALVVWLTFALAMMHMAAKQSPAVWKAVEKVSERE